MCKAAHFIVDKEDDDDGDGLNENFRNPKYTHMHKHPLIKHNTDFFLVLLTCYTRN